MARFLLLLSVLLGVVEQAGAQQRYAGPDGKLRIALVKQPFLPNGTSVGPTTMANGGIQDILASLGATTRVAEIGLTEEEDKEYGGWKRLGMALGHFADQVARNEKEGWFTVGLLATCPSMPGLVAGLQHSGPTVKALRIGMLWLDGIPTSIRRRPPGADRWVECPSRSPLDGRSTSSASTPISFHPWTTATSSWAGFAWSIRSSSRR